MRLILHIWRKDWAARWPIVLLFWATLAIVFLLPPREFLNARSADGQHQVNAARLLDFVALLPFALIGAVVFQVIQAESVLNPKAYWLTRPIPRWTMLTAKLLFVITAIQLPLLVAHLLIPVSRGWAQMVPSLQELFDWQEAPLVTTAVFFGVASITRSGAQAVATLFSGALGLILLLPVFPPRIPASPVPFVAFVLSSVTLVYLLRKNWPARVLVLLTPLLIWTPWLGGVESAASKKPEDRPTPPKLTAEAHTAVLLPRMQSLFNNRGTELCRLYLRVEGLSDGQLLTNGGVTLVDPETGEELLLPGQRSTPWLGTYLPGNPLDPKLQDEVVLEIPKSHYHRLRHKRLRFSAEIGRFARSDDRTALIGVNQTVRVPSVGICSSIQGKILCETGRMPQTLVITEDVHDPANRYALEWPADTPNRVTWLRPGIVRTTDRNQFSDVRVTFSTLVDAAPVRLDFTATFDDTGWKLQP